MKINVSILWNNRFVDKKSFEPSPYPMFSLNNVDNRVPLGFYGEEAIEENEEMDIN